MIKNEYNFQGVCKPTYDDKYRVISQDSPKNLKIACKVSNVVLAK